MKTISIQSRLPVCSSLAPLQGRFDTVSAHHLLRHWPEHPSRNCSLRGQTTHLLRHWHGEHVSSICHLNNTNIAIGLKTISARPLRHLKHACCFLLSEVNHPSRRSTISSCDDEKISRLQSTGSYTPRHWLELRFSGALIDSVLLWHTSSDRTSHHANLTSTNDVLDTARKFLIISSA